MISSSPIVFISKGFLISYLKCRNGTWTYYSNELKRLLIFLEYLLESKADIYLEISQDIINELSQKTFEECSSIEDNEEKLFLFYFHKIKAR